MASVLLTGAAGFIGARTAEELLAGGHSVIGVDDLNDYYDPRLKERRLARLLDKAGFAFYKADIADLAALKEIFAGRKFDAVINLAARAGVRYSLKNPWAYYRTNVMGNLNLLELCKDYGIKKYVLASTSSLYAGLPMPFVESLPATFPISPYAASKGAAEMTCYTYHKLYGLDVSVVRYFTVYGPAGRPDMSVFRFIRWIDEGTELILYGDGSQKRDFTYVDDIAAGTVKAMKPVGFEVINLGDNRPRPLTDVIRLIEDRLGKKAVVKHLPFQDADMAATWAEITKAKNLLAWEPRVSLEEGLQRTVDWYLENKEWAKEIAIDLSK